MSPFEHPDPDWTPRLSWGNHIPLRWIRVSPGLWFAWPPQQFETLEPDGPNIWSSSSRWWSGYTPARQVVPPTDATFPPESPESLVIEWGGAIPSRWRQLEDSRTMVSIRELQVSLPPCRVQFRLRYDPFNRDRNFFFYPSFIWDPPIVSPTPWASARVQPHDPAKVNDRTWFYLTPEGRRWVANVMIEPTGVTIEPLEILPPLNLPSEAKIASEEQKLRTCLRVDEAALIHRQPPERMLCNLATSKVLMECVGDDAFAASFEVFVRQNDFRHLPSGKIVDFRSDNAGAWMVAVLRRYGETWQDCEFGLRTEHTAHAEKLARLFREVGYVACDWIPDEEAKRDRLKHVGASIPCAILEHILGKADVSPAIQLAWAMGHFWSDKDGWTEPAFPLSSERYDIVQGGHIAAATEIVKMILAGEISPDN